MHIACGCHSRNHTTFCERRKKQLIVIFVGKNAVKRSNHAALRKPTHVNSWAGYSAIPPTNVLKECLHNYN